MNSRVRKRTYHKALHGTLKGFSVYIVAFSDLELQRSIEEEEHQMVCTVFATHRTRPADCVRARADPSCHCGADCERACECVGAEGCGRNPASEDPGECCRCYRSLPLCLPQASKGEDPEEGEEVVVLMDKEDEKNGEASGAGVGGGQVASGGALVTLGLGLGFLGGGMEDSFPGMGSLIVDGFGDDDFETDPGDADGGGLRKNGGQKGQKY